MIPWKLAAALAWAASLAVAWIWSADHERGLCEIEVAEAVAAANARTAEQQTNVDTTARDGAEQTHDIETRIATAETVARKEIQDAADAGDTHALYVAWAAGADRVWHDQGFTPAASPDDPGPGRSAPAVSAAFDA